MINGRNILVTGGAGFIGANLVRRLAAEGARVRATVHRREAVIDDARVEHVRADLLAAEDCLRVCERMDWVVHCAAQTSGALVIEQTPLAHLTPNVIMNTRMLEAAHRCGVQKFLFISSNTVYPVSDEPMREEDARNEFFEKYFIVGWMKRFSEIVCEMYATRIKSPMSAIVVRPANVYGPRDDFDWETSHVIPALIRKVVERHDPVEVWGDGRDVKDFIYVDDLTEGLTLALERLEGFEIINLASGNGYVLGDILRLILKLDGYADAHIAYNADKPTMIPRRLIDPSRARELLDFSAGTDLESGLAETIRWYREHPATGT